MQVLVLNGSPHSDGMTAALLRAVVEPLREAEHPVEWVDVQRLNMKVCRGCMDCRPEEECRMPRDDGHLVGKSLRAADLLIVGTPNYWGNMTAPLKILFDRNVTAFESFAGGRPRPRKRGSRGFVVVTSDSSGPTMRRGAQARGALRAVTRILRAGGVRISGRLLAGDRRSFDARRERLEARARRAGQRLARRLRRRLG